MPIFFARALTKKKRVGGGFAILDPIARTWNVTKVRLNEPNTTIAYRNGSVPERAMVQKKSGTREHGTWIMEHSGTCRGTF